MLPNPQSDLVASLNGAEAARLGAAAAHSRIRLIYAFDRDSRGRLDDAAHVRDRRARAASRKRQIPRRPKHISVHPMRTNRWQFVDASSCNSAAWKESSVA